MTKKELFVGNLGKEVSKRDVEDLFDKYGKIIRCDVKSKDFGNSFCFLEFEDERDAEDALKNENGKDIGGSSMIVEWAKSKSDRRDNRGYGDRRGGGGRDFGGRGGSGGFRGGDRNGSRGGDRNGGGRSLECFNCGESGHFARDCRKGGSRGGDRGSARGGDRGGDRGGERNGDRNEGDRRPPRRDNHSRSRSR